MKLANSSLVVAASLCTGLLLGQAASCTANSPEHPVYRPPTSAQLESAEQLFTWLFSGQSPTSARSSAAALGFTWRETETKITLQDEEKRGWGDYRFSKIASGNIALQAPHRYHDTYTGVIAKKLFALHGFNSVALNSLSRRTPQDNASGATADMAHLTSSFHTAYSRAFAVRYPQGKLIQLHGFSAEKRRSPEARHANIIISTGSSRSSAYLLETQRCFADEGWHTLRYPQQVRELGATKNSIGSLLRSIGHGGFTHIELSLQMREQLTNEEAQLKSFSDCLLLSTP